MFSNKHFHEAFVTMTQNILRNNWNWDFVAFCARCNIDQESEYAKRQWKAFRDLTEALHTIDGDILAVVSGPDVKIGE